MKKLLKVSGAAVAVQFVSKPESCPGLADRVARSFCHAIMSFSW